MIAESKKHRGSVSIIVAISLVVLIGTVGLAVDSGLSYMVKGKLNAAVDAAAVAAARGVSEGDTQAQQIANAKQAAQDFFAANYPNGYLGTTHVFTVNDPIFDRGKVTIDVSASAVMPVTFMKVLGFNLVNVGAAAQAVRKDLDLGFVVDTTGSLAPPTSPSSVFPKVKEGAKMFLDKLNPNTDRVALIHFASGAVVDDPIRLVNRGFDRTSMHNHINAFVASGFTNSAEGFWHARNQLNGIAPINRSTLRVIVFFSDGSPNSFSSYFTFNNPAACNQPGTISTSDSTSQHWPTGLRRHDQVSANLPGGCWRDDNIADQSSATHITRLPDWYNAHNPLNDPALQEFRIVTNAPRVVTSDTSSRASAWRNVNRAARNLLEAMAAKSRSEGIYIFTLGLGGVLRTGTGPDNEKGEDLLKCMANTPDSLARCYNPNQPVGVYCFAETENDLKPCFAQLAAEILRITR